ncbi:MAG TPA: SAF domain-containing protein [Acidimicrobiales bacterium]|nr:SAF domain-containing protein [Acidimicrobiales bacterium]
MAAPAADVRVGPGIPGGLRVLPRRARGNARAIAGGFAVALAVVLVFAGWLATRPGRPHPFVVAAGPLAAGTRLTARDLGVTELRLPAAVAATSYPQAAALVGRVLAVPLRPGELVSAPELTPTGGQPPLRPVTVTVPGPDLLGLVPAERVDVFVTTSTGSTARTALLLRGAEVLRVATPSGGLLGGGGGTGSDVLVLGVPSLGEVESLVAAGHAGSLDVTVAEPSDGVGPGPGTGGSGGH